MNNTIDIKQLLACLNYSDSPFFFEGSRLDAVHAYSNAFRNAKDKCGLKGVYSLDGNHGESSTGKSIIPLVYVCEAESEEKAIEIHRLVWNQNCVPFLIVVTPKSIRLYPGFKFDTRNQTRNKDQNLVKIARSANEVLEKLSDFSAQSINSGAIWRNWNDQVSPDKRVDHNLLKNLEKLGKSLRNSGLREQTAHSLIGKFVYFRYLRDRDILSDRKLEQWNIDLNSVFGRNATFSGFRILVEKIDKWLNGSVFPIPTKGMGVPSDKHIQKVASVFLGDDPVSEQMHLDFRAYNFEHIPIETLSVVYQQFLQAEKRGSEQGAYYTPVHLVNFMLDELDSKKRLVRGMKVFDPACGSGAFVVQCFRRLIERELSLKNESKLKPSELKSLLVKHIFGVDIDEDACGVTELSLILTLLDYIEPPDLEENEYHHFKLPALRGRNILFLKNGFFDQKSIQAKSLSRMQFDWIVGNPPWKVLSNNSASPSDQSALNWIKENKKEFPVNQYQLAEAFVWKASLNLSNDGITGFLLPGKTLFKNQKNAEEFRASFFNKMDVWCIVNFSNLRRILFKNATNPAIAFFYKAARKNSERPRSILTYAPFAMNQMLRCNSSKGSSSRLWTVIVNADEMCEIPYRDVLSGASFPWKIAMWGSVRDKYLLTSLQKAFDNLRTFSKKNNLVISQGLELRTANGKDEVEPAPEVAGKKQLVMEELKKCGKIFSFPENALKTIHHSKANVRKRGGRIPLTICRPPHVIVDANRRFSVFSDKFLVIPPRQIGIAGDQSKKNLLKALALYLNSDFVQYQQYLSSPSWGIGMERLTKKDFDSLPVPLDNLSHSEVEEWAVLYDELAKQFPSEKLECDFFQRSKRLPDVEPLLDALNEKTNILIGLSETERYNVDDFIKTRMRFNDGAVPKDIMDELASENDLIAYSRVLKEALDDFLDSDKRNQHKITVSFSSSMVLLSIEHSKDLPADPIYVKEVKDSELEDELRLLERNLESTQGQWIYFQKSLKYYHGRTTYHIKTRKRLGWLKSQAFTDADEFIAEKLITTRSE